MKAFLIVLLLACFAVANGTRASERLALIVGNGTYENTSTLLNPPADANLMANTLNSLGFETSVLINANQIEIKGAIVDFGRDLRAAGPDSVGLFYYAGHGVQSQSQNYLIPVDAEIADEADLEVFGVRASWVLRQMDSARNAMNIVVLDACRDNPFARSFRSAERGLARMDAPAGTFVAYATAPGDVAVDGKGRNSPYTEALARHLTSPGLPIEHVFKRVRVDVLGATRGNQIPWDSSSLIQDFYFVPPEKPAAPNSPEVEAQLWTEVRRSGDPGMLDAFLELYPRSEFRSEAVELRKSLLAATDGEANPDGTAMGTAAVASVAKELDEKAPSKPIGSLDAVPPRPESPGKAATPAAQAAIERARRAEGALSLSRRQAAGIQRRLSLLGLDTRGIDGIFGTGTRAAIRMWQAENGVAVTGFLDAEQIRRLEVQTNEAFTRFVRETRTQANVVNRDKNTGAPATEPSGTASNVRSGRYISADGCLREADGRIVAGFKAGCE